MSVGAGSGKKLPVLPAREPIAECGVCGQPMYRNQSIDQCSWRQKGELADLQCPLWDLTWDWNCEDRFPAVAGDELGKADVENALNVLGEVRDDDGSLIDVPGPDLVYDAAGKPHEPMVAHFSTFELDKAVDCLVEDLQKLTLRDGGVFRHEGQPYNRHGDPVENKSPRVSNEKFHKEPDRLRILDLESQRDKLLSRQVQLRYERAALRDALAPFVQAFEQVVDITFALQSTDPVLLPPKGLRLCDIWDARRVLKETEKKP